MWAANIRKPCKCIVSLPVCLHYYCLPWLFFTSFSWPFLFIYLSAIKNRIQTRNLNQYVTKQRQCLQKLWVRWAWCLQVHVCYKVNAEGGWRRVVVLLLTCFLCLPIIVLEWLSTYSRIFIHGVVFNNKFFPLLV